VPGAVVTSTSTPGPVPRRWPRGSRRTGRAAGGTDGPRAGLDGPARRTPGPGNPGLLLPADQSRLTCYWPGWTVIVVVKVADPLPTMVCVPGVSGFKSATQPCPKDRPVDPAGRPKRLSAGRTMFCDDPRFTGAGTRGHGGGGPSGRRRSQATAAATRSKLPSICSFDTRGYRLRAFWSRTPLQS
jgi:hypothetical protein